MLRLIDSFDHYAIGDIFGKWASGVTTAASMSTSPVRTGAQALALGVTPGVASDTVTTALGATSTTIIVGFGFRYAFSVVDRTHLLVFGADSTGGVGCHIGLDLNASGTLTAYRNTGAGPASELGGFDNAAAVSLGSSGNALSVNQWNYLEVKVVLHASAGSVAVRVNGSSAGWITVSGVQTLKAGIGAYCNVVGISGPSSAAGSGTPLRYYYDDLYLADGTAGDGVTDFLGPQKIATVIASAGNGTYTDFTPSTGTDHGALVDDATPNGDTDYVSDATVGHRDSYNFPALGVVGTVTAVQAVQWAKLDLSGARAINSFARISSTNYDHATPNALDTTYRAARAIWTTSPATAGAWTVAEIDGAEFGVRVQA